MKDERNHSQDKKDGYEAAMRELGKAANDDQAVLKETLSEIHKIASAGCPVGCPPDSTFEGISEMCAEVLK